MAGAPADNHELFQSLFNLAPEGIFIADLEGQYTDVNEAACALLNTPRKDLIGKTIFDLIPEEDSQRLLDEKTHMQQPKTVVTSEWNLKKKDGSFVPVEVSAAILEDGRWVGFVRDIAERKELERLRQQWVAVVAHDLRQPVQEILLASESIRRANEESHEHLRDIVSSVRTLSRLTDDLFDAARLATQRFTIERRTFDLRDLVAHAAKRAELSSGRSIKITAHGGPFTFWGDEQRIGQVVDNLLSNAAKYSEKDSTITLDLIKETHRFICSVSNRGAGLSEEEIRMVFNRFYRAPGSAQMTRGTGLGLYIAKGLIEAHGGNMWAESTPGNLTTFTFTLPLEYESDTAVQPKETGFDTLGT